MLATKDAHRHAAGAEEELRQHHGRNPQESAAAGLKSNAEKIFRHYDEWPHALLAIFMRGSDIDQLTHMDVHRRQVFGVETSKPWRL